MQVQLTYFRSTNRSGKYYTEGFYETEKEHMFEIWEEVREMLEKRNLPGLVAGHDPYYVLVDVKEHPFYCPHLLVP